jgi:hypothetical protein
MDEFDTIDHLKERLRFLEGQLAKEQVLRQECEGRIKTLREPIPFGGNIHHDLSQLNPQALFSDGHEDALMGYTINTHMPNRAVYDAERCAEIMMKDGMTWEEAFEFLDFNTFCAYVGDSGPLYLSRGRW